MSHRYKNAAIVLPPEVYDQVLEAMGGRACYLWIPARCNLNRRGRDRHIHYLRAKGFTAATIADRLLISERTVWRVLAKKKNKNNTDETGGSTNERADAAGE